MNKVGNELQKATTYEDRAQQSPVTRWSRHKTVAHVTLRNTLASTANILQTAGDLHPVCLGLRCQGLARPSWNPGEDAEWEEEPPHPYCFKGKKGP